MKENGGFHKKENTSKSPRRNKYCHKCSKLSNFSKDCPIHEMEHKHYVKTGDDKCKWKVCVLDISKRRFAVDYIVKQNLAALGNSLMNLLKYTLNMLL